MKLSLIILLFILSGCSDSKIRIDQQTQELIRKEACKNGTWDVFFIIPATYCPSCPSFILDKAMYYSKVKKNIKIIYECFPENYKMLNYRLNKNKIDSLSYIIDTCLIYNIKPIEYPKLVYVNRNRLSVDMYSSDNQGVFDDLEKYLLNKKNK